MVGNGGRIKSDYKAAAARGPPQPVFGAEKSMPMCAMRVFFDARSASERCHDADPEQIAIILFPERIDPAEIGKGAPILADGTVQLQ